jgi:hypothetical protein
LRSADDPAGDLATIGDEEGLNHQCTPDNKTKLRVGGTMFKLYCLPGKFFARLGYLFPGKNQLWASGRRRDSSLAHFLFATPFWVLLGLFVIGPILSSFSNRDRGSVSETEMEDDAAVESSAPSNDIADTPITIESSELKPEPVVDTPALETKEPEIIFVPGTGAEAKSGVEASEERSE